MNYRRFAKYVRQTKTFHLVKVISIGLFFFFGSIIAFLFGVVAYLYLGTSVTGDDPNILVYHLFITSVLGYVWFKMWRRIIDDYKKFIKRGKNNGKKEKE